MLKGIAWYCGKDWTTDKIVDGYHVLIRSEVLQLLVLGNLKVRRTHTSPELKRLFRHIGWRTEDGTAYRQRELFIGWKITRTLLG